MFLRDLYSDKIGKNKRKLLNEYKIGYITKLVREKYFFYSIKSVERY